MALPWCGNDVNEYYHLQKWKLIVATNRKGRAANGFVLEANFPTEPADGEMNVDK